MMRPIALAIAAALVAAAACNDRDGGGTPTAPAGQAGEGAGGELPTMGGTGSGSSAGGEGDPAAGNAGQDSSAGVGGAGGASGDPYATLRHPPYPPSPYPAENPDSEAKALLGKILFWDEQLSGDGTVACGTCHRPNAGGSDPRSVTAAAQWSGPDGVAGTLDDVHGSLGVLRCSEQGAPIGEAVQRTGRKAPTYLDAMFAPRLFWDGRAECAKDGCPSFSAFEDPDAPGSFPIKSGGALESQAVGPPLSPVEMACEGATWSAIHERLRTAEPLALAHELPDSLARFIDEHDGSYPELFRAAFGSEQTSGPTDEINTRRIAFAIATHERRLRSDQTPWDRFNAGEDDALTPGQIRGLEVFLGAGRCEGCHRMPTFSDGDFHFIGFHRPAWDAGRKAVSAFVVAGALRTPTLRNVGLRAATGLLHNGAGTGASLAHIIDLYDQGGLVEDIEVTSVPIDAAIVSLGLSPGQKADLLDFLAHALDDPRVAAQLPPFDRPLLATE